jgi:hypothetical protein
MTLPLSEEEQRILQEMEQKLREHDRDFVERVSHSSHRLHASRGTKWSVFGFVVGTVLALGTFRSSLALAVCGVLVMLVSALAFAQYLGEERRPPVEEGAGAAGDRRKSHLFGRSPLGGGDWSERRRWMRSRRGHRD